MSDIKYLVVHCSDSPNDRDSVDAQTIHKWHLERGWSGIGYHYVILRNGEVQHGRPDYWKGAHAKKVNDRSLGICLVGKDKFTESQFKSLKMLLLVLIKEYPYSKVRGHYDFEPNKTCPNFNVEAWWEEAKND